MLWIAPRENEINTYEHAHEQQNSPPPKPLEALEDKRGNRCRGEQRALPKRGPDVETGQESARPNAAQHAEDRQRSRERNKQRAKKERLTDQTGHVGWHRE